MIAFALALLLSAAPDAGTDPRDVYLQAYQLKDTDPAQAKKLFQWVVDHTPKTDDDHDKAKRWVKDLSRRRR